MRRGERAMTDPRAVEAFLEAAPVGRLATVGEDGWPVIKPVNFVWADGAVYLHSAPAGEKMDHLRRDGRVCFEADLAIAYVKAGAAPCRATCLYRSVVVRGRARVVEDREEKRRALALLLAKHEGPGDYPMADGALDATAVVRIDVETVTGKESLGAGRVREEAERALSCVVSLPLVLEGG
ncbi:MAG: pyridoxamine 5'-phosphate oxidase family protein [Deltaproteobacteria bacterium]|nr:pyridoxamine 5'-phosphate oxidase family protein [Deltaproteobacteria bacterium]